MINFEIKNLLLIVLIAFIFIACSKSDAQKEFENEAFRTPENITETTANGSLVENGSVDPEDWRIGPDYQGLIRIDPAYPNPVNINSNLLIEVDFLFSNPVSELIVFTFQDPALELRFIDSFDQSSLGAIDVLNIPAPQIALPSGVGTSPVYRIIITDQNENIITYGDVEVIQ
jgi:hypothetical protein